VPGLTGSQLIVSIRSKRYSNAAIFEMIPLGRFHDMTKRLFWSMVMKRKESDSHDMPIAA